MAEMTSCATCKVKVHFSWRYCPACGTPTDYNYKGIKMTIEELAKETADRLRELICNEYNGITPKRATERLIEELQYNLGCRSHLAIDLAKLK